MKNEETTKRNLKKKNQGIQFTSIILLMIKLKLNETVVLPANDKTLQLNETVVQQGNSKLSYINALKQNINHKPPTSNTA